jgi:NAD(P)-dependent dehydrogenase (short-subunit alcohol dehydrogenase family)
MAEGKAEQFEGTVAVVAGSTSDPSIGRSCARKLAERGAAVVVNGRSPDAVRRAERALREAGHRAVGVAGAAEDEGLAERLVSTAVEQFGRIDFVVNTVGGASYSGSPRMMGRAALVDTLALNTWPSVALVQAALDRGLAERHGAVVFVSSGTVHLTTPTMIAYKAAKSALNALVATLARDLAPSSVRVNAVAPGLTVTSATLSLLEGGLGARAGAEHPLGRLPHADDVADVAVFLLSDAASMVTGQIIDVDAGAHLIGGWSPYTPPRPSAD